MRDFSYEEIASATSAFSLENLVGKGSHGSVYKGIILSGPGKQAAVAVKKPSDAPGLASKLDNEIDILSSVRSPNIVNLIGICRAGPACKLLVAEFMPNGSLHSLLHSPSSSPPAWPRRMLMALQVASAVLSLHSATPCSIVHRDVKSENVLLDGGWNARLADFSLAVRAHGFMAVPAAGTFGYLDPGYTAADRLSLKTDVFSFGVLLLELVSSRKAMDVDKEPASVVSWALPLIREGRAAEVCDGRVGLGAGMERLVAGVLGVAARCVSRREELRPTMAEVVGELRVAVDTVSWPSWGRLRSKFSRAWRRCKKKRVTTTTTKKKKIVCKDHLIVDDDDDEDEI